MSIARAYEIWQAASFRRQLLIVTGIGLFLRLLVALLIPFVPSTDQAIYFATSQNLAQHGVYGVTPEEPFSYWPVGASIFYALSYEIFGINAFAPKIVNLVSGAALIFTTGWLGRRWIGEAGGIVSAALIALWPSLILYGSVMASEVLFCVFVNLFLIAWRPEEQQWGRAAALAGLCLGAAILIRPVALLLPVVVLISSYFLLISAHVSSWRLTARPALAMALSVVVAGLAIAPWTLRNLDLHGEIVLVSTNGGPNLWMGNHEGSPGTYVPLPAYTEEMSEVERAAHLKAEAISYMAENPVRTLGMTIYRVAHTHSWETIGVAWTTPGIEQRFGTWPILPLKAISSGYWLVLLAAGLAGVVILCRRGLAARSFQEGVAHLANPALLLWAYYAAVHGVIVSGDRYHFSQIPFIAILAALAIHALSAAARSRLASKKEPSAS